MRRRLWHIPMALGAVGVILAGTILLRNAWRGNSPISARQAVLEAEQALRRDPAMLEPETRQAVRLGAALSIREATRSAEALFIQGVQFEREGDTRQAEDRYWNATEQRQDYAAAWVALGLLLSRKGGRENLERAEAALAWAVALEPGWARARSAHAIVLRKAGKVEEAAAEARAAVDLDPSDPAARNNLGNALLALGDVDGAAEAYRSAMDLDPDQAMPRYNLACARVQQGRVEEALTLLDEAFRLDGSLRSGAAADPDLAPLLNRPEFQALLRGYTLDWAREHGAPGACPGPPATSEGDGTAAPGSSRAADPSVFHAETPEP